MYTIRNIHILFFLWVIICLFRAYCSKVPIYIWTASNEYIILSNVHFLRLNSTEHYIYIPQLSGVFADLSYFFLFFFTNNDRFSKLATAFAPVERSGLDLCAFKSRDENDGRDGGCPRGTFPTREERNVEISNVENIQTDLLSKQIVRPQWLNNETFVTIHLPLIFASRYSPLLSRRNYYKCPLQYTCKYYFHLYLFVIRYVFSSFFLMVDFIFFIVYITNWNKWRRRLILTINQCHCTYIYIYVYNHSCMYILLFIR